MPDASAARLIIPASSQTPQAVYTFARTVYGEARGEGRPGQEDVAAVIINRLAIALQYHVRHPAKPFWWGDTIPAICLHPFGFSCWNQNDPNRAKLLAGNITDPAYLQCLSIARLAAAGDLIDRTKGATHYKVTSLPWPRDWGPVVSPVFVEGHHSFYIIH